MTTKPSLYSKKALILLAALYTPFFSSLVYASNLQEVDKRNFIAPTIISMLIINGIIFNQIVPKLPLPLYITWPLVNTIVSFLLVGPFWDYHIKDETEYEEKKIWSPLLAGFVVFGGFIIVGFALKYLR